ncbi:Endonuclease/Exonuclease/phosphatase family protein [Actinomadura rubteroloni]|uniref:Endonuclease/Exonuclease/phosphatase family protein n=1 Tax=Actinomadura rubteroloni TaxID=1926885 RepID=A0A2P4UEK0_9ACTN|nr:endonuclease/exonuclease/phosphatase family protein [Actinomadura rubteroloni]POM23487.1 Endonuclease/Exonuclease/phosphatase family protein [Actinomadura rubteroloni]
MTTIGTWNLENLFRPGGDFGPSDEAAYKAKVKDLAATITASGVDALAVEEVGDPDALADVAARLDGDWHHVTSAGFEPGHPIRVGFLSRLPLEVVADRSAFPDELTPIQAGDDGTSAHKTGRGVLAVRITERDGREITAVAAHLKSKLLSFPPGPDGRPRFQPRDEGERARVAAYALYRRTAEAVTVRALADELLAGQGQTRQVMVMGDLNDGIEAATTQILLGPPGSELGTPGADHPDQGDRHRLWNLAPRVPEAERYSRVFHGRGELIDHILVSHALLGRATDVHTCRPPNAPKLPSVTDDPAARRNEPASDHAMVFTRLAD